MESSKGWILLALLSLLGCEAAGPTITPEDLQAIVVRRSVCQGVALTPAIFRVVAGATGSAAAASSELSCGRSASTCEGFLECAGLDPGATCDPSSDARCDGDVLERCHPSTMWLQRRDCTRDDDGNTACVVDDFGEATCAIGSCDGVSGLRCEDDVIIFCGNGIERHSDDCRLSERTCVSQGDRAACVDRVEACVADVCEGDVLLDCSAELGTREVDCSARIGGGRCAVVEGVARCVSDDMECTDAEGGCEGSVARYCLDGRWVELDCATFLGATCVDRSTTSLSLACVSERWTTE